MQTAAYSPSEAWSVYLQAVKGQFVKLAKLEFLQPDGSVAFALDNNAVFSAGGERCFSLS